MSGSNPDYKKYPKLRDEDRLTNGEPTWHDHVLAEKDPERDARQAMRARKLAKEMFGWPEEELDKLYGPNKGG